MSTEVTVQEVSIALTLTKDANNVVSIASTPTNQVTVNTSNTTLEITQPVNNTININEPTPNVINISNQTVIQPPPVDEATKLVIVRTANEDIAAWQWVRLVSSTLVELTDDTTYEDSLAVGIALESKLTGQSIRILTLGIAEDASFTYALNDPIFLGSNGGDTVTPTTTVGEFVTQVAQSLGPGAINITIGKPVEIL